MIRVSNIVGFSWDKVIKVGCDGFKYGALKRCLVPRVRLAALTEPVGLKRFFVKEKTRHFAIIRPENLDRNAHAHFNSSIDNKEFLLL